MADQYGVKITFSSDLKQLVADLRGGTAEMERFKAAAKSTTGAVTTGSEKASDGLGNIFVKLLRLRAGFVVLGLIVAQTFNIITGNAIKAQEEMGAAAGKAQLLVNEIQSLTLDKNIENHRRLNKELGLLAVRFGQIFESVAKAKYDVISAGFTNAADSAYILQQASMLAVAGVTEIGSTAKLVTSILNAYGLSADHAGAVSDILFATVQKGVTTIPELGGALGRVIPIASTAGVALNEVGAAMASLTKQGLKTQEAATVLRALMSALTGGSAETKGMLADLGITLDDGLGPALEAISKATGDSAKKLADLFGNIRALTAAAAAGKDGARLYNEALEEIAMSAGSSAAAFEIVAANAETASSRMDEALKKIKREMGEAFGKDQVDNVADFTAAVDRMGPQMVSNAQDMGRAVAQLSREFELLKLEALDTNNTMSGTMVLGLAYWTKKLREAIPAQKAFIEMLIKSGGNVHHAAIAYAHAALVAKAAADDIGDLGAAGQLTNVQLSAAFAEGSIRLQNFRRRLDNLTAAWKSGELAGQRYRDLHQNLWLKFKENANELEILAAQTLAGSEAWENLKLAPGIASSIQNANNSTVVQAAKMLGVEISDLIVEGSVLKLSERGAQEIGNRIVDRLQEIQTKVNAANAKGAEIGFDIMNLDDIDLGNIRALTALKAQMDAALEIVAQYGESSGKSWQDKFIEALDPLSRRMSMFFGESFVLASDATVDSAIADLRAKLEAHGLGATIAELEDLYNIDLLKIDADNADAAISLLRDTLSQARIIARDELYAMSADIDLVIDTLAKLNQAATGDTADKIESLMDRLGRAGTAGEATIIIKEIIDLLVEMGYVSQALADSDSWDEWSEKLKEIRDELELVNDSTSALINDVKTGLANAFSDAGAKAIEMSITGQRYAIMLGNMIRQVLIKAMMDYIAKLVVATALQRIIGIPLSGGGMVPGKGYSRGGIVSPLRAASGMIVPNLSGSQAGMDSVHAILTPGEGVIKRHTMQRLENVIGMMEQAARFGAPQLAAVGGGGGMTVINNFNISRPQSRTDSEEMARTIDDFNRTLERRRY